MSVVARREHAGACCAELDRSLLRIAVPLKLEAPLRVFRGVDAVVCGIAEDEAAIALLPSRYSSSKRHRSAANDRSAAIAWTRAGTPLLPLAVQRLCGLGGVLNGVLFEVFYCSHKT